MSRNGFNVFLYLTFIVSVFVMSFLGITHGSKSEKRERNYTCLPHTYVDVIFDKQRNMRVVCLTDKNEFVVRSIKKKGK
jgi:hypothetical protein